MPKIICRIILRESQVGVLVLYDQMAVRLSRLSGKFVRSLDHRGNQTLRLGKEMCPRDRQSLTPLSLITNCA